MNKAQKIVIGVVLSFLVVIGVGVYTAKEEKVSCYPIVKDSIVYNPRSRSAAKYIKPDGEYIGEVSDYDVVRGCKLERTGGIGRSVGVAMVIWLIGFVILMFVGMLYGLWKILGEDGGR